MTRRPGLAAAVALLVVAVAAPARAEVDPYRPQQWHLDRIGAPDAWETARGAGQVVAVLDSGVDPAHPDLVDRLVRDDEGALVGRDVVDDDDDPTDPLGHGTMVAGIAAATADNGEGIAGVAPEASILPVRVLDEEGGGTSADVDEGIRWAVDHGATVVNLSLESADTLPDSPDLAGQTAPVDAVAYAAEHGVVVVAATGNSGNTFTDYPSSSPVVLVGTTGRDDQRATFSDSGRDDLLMAPGVEIVSTWCRAPGSDRCDSATHNYGIADGTSFSAPQVAGAIAVLRSAGLSGEQAVRVLRDTAVDLEEPGRDDGTGFGRIDLAAAMAAAASVASESPAPTDEPLSPGPRPASSGEASVAPTPSRAAAPSATPSPSPAPSDRGMPTPPSAPVAAPPPVTGPPRDGWVAVAALLLAAATAGQILARRRA